MMQCALLRRGLLLAPPSREDQLWLVRSLGCREIKQAFGYELREGCAHVPPNQLTEAGVIYRKRSTDWVRVGFVAVFPPAHGFPVSEVACAIPDRRHRDGFTAIGAADAITMYLLEIRNEPVIGFRVRQKGRAARAVIRRLGYRAVATMISSSGEAVDFYRVDRRDWWERKNRLGVPGGFQVLNDYQEAITRSH